MVQYIELWDRLCHFPLSGDPDRLVWRWTVSGVYSPGPATMSYYWALVQLRIYSSLGRHWHRCGPRFPFGLSSMTRSLRTCNTSSMDAHFAGRFGLRSFHDVNLPQRATIPDLVGGHFCPCLDHVAEGVVSLLGCNGYVLNDHRLFVLRLVQIIQEDARLWARVGAKRLYSVN